MIDCNSNNLLKIAESISGELTVDDLAFLLGFAKAVDNIGSLEEKGAAKMLQILFDKGLIKYKD